MTITSPSLAQHRLYFRLLFVSCLLLTGFVHTARAVGNIGAVTGSSAAAWNAQTSTWSVVGITNTGFAQVVGTAFPETHTWASSSASALWWEPENWNSLKEPESGWQAMVINFFVASTQQAIVSDDSTVHSIDVAGIPGAMSIVVESGTTLTATHGVHVGTNGRIDLQNGTLTTTTLELDGGSLIGQGSVQADINNAGVLSPGNSAGQIDVTGSYTQTIDGTLAIEIGGLAAGTEYDRLNTVTAELAGTLDVELFNGFTPSLSDSFEILTATTGITGTFDNLLLPALAGNLAWNVLYGVSVSFVGGC